MLHASFIADRHALDAIMRHVIASSVCLAHQGFQAMSMIDAQCTDQSSAACMHCTHPSRQRIEIIIIDHHRERIIG